MGTAFAILAMFWNLSPTGDLLWCAQTCQNSCLGALKLSWSKGLSREKWEKSPQKSPQKSTQKTAQTKKSSKKYSKKVLKLKSAQRSTQKSTQNSAQIKKCSKKY